MDSNCERITTIESNNKLSTGYLNSYNSIINTSDGRNILELILID